MRAILKRPRAALAILALAVVVGCGSANTSVPLSSLESGALDLAGKMLRIELNDGQILRFEATRLEYPYLWGQRFVGERMPRRDMRIDLRDVRDLKILEG